MSADEIMKKAGEKAGTFKSASFTADLKLTVTADQSKASDAQLQQLTQGPITLHSEGKVQSDPQAIDTTISLSVGSQNMTFGVKSVDKKTYVQVENQWYAVPESQTQGLQDLASGSPDQQLQSLGIDPMSWASERKVTGTETVDGATCYHVVAKADTKKVASDIVKVLNDPKLQEAVGGSASTVEQLKTENDAQIKALEESLSEVTSEYWVDTSTYNVRKGKFVIKFAFTGDLKNQGMDAAEITIEYTSGDYDQPVTVEAPTDTKPFDQLMSGSGLGGGLGTSSSPFPSATGTDSGTGF